MINRKRVRAVNSIIYAMILLISGVFNSPVKNVKEAKAATSVIENAITWAISIANDNSHGYSQSNRWGPDYDCSSFVISAFRSAGLDVGTATYTGNMRSQFTQHGFTWIPWNNIGSVSNLQRGDILLNEVSHTEIYLGGNQNVGAHSDRGYPQSGDQTGTEISVSGYYNHPWNGVLRYNGTTYEKPVVNTWRYEHFNNGVRPVVEVNDPSNVSSVLFYLRFGATAEWKMYSGKYNLANAWYCEASYDELSGEGDVVCHVYIYGKDGSQQSFAIEKPRVSSTRYEYFKNGIRPILAIENPESVSSVTYYLRYGSSAKWKSYVGKFNLANAWYCESLFDELNGVGSVVCGAYVDGKDGSHEYVGFDSLSNLKNIEETRYEYFNNGVRPVVEIANHSKVNNVTFYLRFGSTAEWKSYVGKFNLAKAWYCEASYDELKGKGYLVCDVYVDYADGTHQYVSGFPKSVSNVSGDEVTEKPTATPAVTPKVTPQATAEVTSIPNATSTPEVKSEMEVTETPTPIATPVPSENGDNIHIATPTPIVVPVTTPTPGTSSSVSSVTSVPSTNSAKVTAPAKVTMKSAKNKKGKKVLVKWKKVNEADGYQIQYAQKKTFKGKKSVTTSKTSYTIKKLKKKKTYYVRVRAYKMNGQTKVYGKWSAVKKVKIKK